MRNKKTLIILVIIIILLGGIGYYIYTKVEISKTEQKLTEYTPEPEITRRAIKKNSNITIFYK